MSMLNILVVDDEPIIGTAFKRELGDQGHQVEYAPNGEVALKSLRLKKYDMVFIDKIMPGMDGIETCRQILKIDPETIPIFMTGVFGKNSAYQEAEFVKAGGRTYSLYKPFSAGELSEVVQKAIEDKNKLIHQKNSDAKE